MYSYAPVALRREAPLVRIMSWRRQLQRHDLGSHDHSSLMCMVAKGGPFKSSSGLQGVAQSILKFLCARQQETLSCTSPVVMDSKNSERDPPVLPLCRRRCRCHIVVKPHLDGSELLFLKTGVTVDIGWRIIDASSGIFPALQQDTSHTEMEPPSYKVVCGTVGRKWKLH
jgi:hypothetical protein